MESTTVTIPDIDLFKKKALHWANYFNTVCLLDNNHYPQQHYHTKDWVLAVDAIEELECGEGAFIRLREFHSKAKTNIFGFFSYDLKNQVEKLSSRNHDGIQFPELYFFQPRYILEIKGDKLTVNRNYPETFDLVERINHLKLPETHPQVKHNLQARTSTPVYIENVKKIRQQIEDGDFYEMNYCCEFFAEHAGIEPVDTFLRLNQKAKAPFSAFFKHNGKYLLCASPERFLKKEQEKIISQPIKGTIKKGKSVEENEQLKEQLKDDIKERAENVMIVDLVRNDLSRSCEPGSVKVEELFGVYEFNTVNQMISTISGTVPSNVHFTNVIKHAFPMGSMTGAPKIEVMKNIERYEDFKRGLYSGSVGYITPSGDFDLNVVIRSILYNSNERYLSVSVGGAITYDSVPEKEYAEILLKAESMFEVLNAQLK